MNAYIAGQLVRCSVQWTDVNGNAVDPTGVTFRVRKTDGTLTTLVYPDDAALVKDAVGEYHVDVDTTGQNGRVSFRFEATGAGQAALEGMFRVQASRVI